MKIYTRTGDQGKTGLLGGDRVYKWDLPIEAYGTLDELNAWIGRIREEPKLKKSEQDFLGSIQQHLFTLGSWLAQGKKLVPMPELDPNLVKDLENNIDQIESTLEPLKNFLLPGGHKSVADIHIARSICRRAERRIAEMQHHTSTQKTQVKTGLIYVNRLSDYLFVLARSLTQQLGVKEIPWIPTKK
ncbi:MAG: cob(I)yrinic acid a,c-diamide adenosyltransferase [Cytophagales bacterium]|nr:cob(I)yrinic acid a,c-diamide adenosyltransferase [Cytophagales bacterium]